MPLEILLANEVGPKNTEEDVGEPSQLVSPGDIITRDSGYMRGHGTYMSNDILYASVAGIVTRVNKLISVTPLKTKYQGEIGDVVIGRVVELQQKRWKIDTNSRLDSVLHLSSVNLPGGELRRRSAEDELTMRKYLREGDLISAEVQNVYKDGSISLHTRSLKYGKLSQGTLLKVSPSLVKRRKTHFHYLPCGASVILGNNGFIWISNKSPNDEIEGSGGGFTQDFNVVPKADRDVISRLRNVVQALANNGVMLWDTTLTYGYDASVSYEVVDLLKTNVMREVACRTKLRLEMEL